MLISKMKQGEKLWRLDHTNDLPADSVSAAAGEGRSKGTEPE